MILGMFHDWILWQDQDRYFLDDAFIKFVTAFDQDFEQILFWGRVASKKANGNAIYPLDPVRHKVCPFPYYQDIYSLYTKGIYIFPHIMHVLKKTISCLDIIWLPAPHPIGVMAAYLCLKQHKPFFFMVRQNLQEQVRHRTKGPKRVASVLLVDLLEKISQIIAKQSLTFTVGQEMFNRYQKNHIPAFPITISLVSEEDLKLNLASNPRSINHTLKILSIGRLEPEKGLKYLIEAIDRLRRMGKINILLTIVGKGKEKALLKEEVRKKGLIEAVQFPGYIKNGPELWNLYQDHDIFILPSLTGEGLPQTLLEAMACQTPVIATTVAGIPFFIQDRVNGLLIPPAQADAICQAIMTLTSENALRHQIIEGGRKTVAAHTLEKEKEKMMIQIRKTLIH